jgi:hypothetical protein
MVEVLGGIVIQSSSSFFMRVSRGNMMVGCNTTLRNQRNQCEYRIQSKQTAATEPSRDVSAHTHTHK